MPYGELYIPEEWSGRNAVTGCFLPGHVPHNKGRKLGDYMTKRAQRRSAKGWKNVVLHRSKTRPDNAGRSPKQIIAVEDDGTWHVFSYIGAAAVWLGGRRENIRRCCAENLSRKQLKTSHGKVTGRVNTDHKYMGCRFYYESDNIWTKKIDLSPK